MEDRAARTKCEMKVSLTSGIRNKVIQQGTLCECVREEDERCAHLSMSVFHARYKGLVNLITLHTCLRMFKTADGAVSRSVGASELMEASCKDGGSFHHRGSRDADRQRERQPTKRSSLPPWCALKLSQTLRKDQAQVAPEGMDG